MDWIDKIYEGFGNWIAGLDLKKSMRLYILTAIMAICLAFLLTVQWCNGWERLIGRGPQEKSFIYTNEEGRKEIVSMSLGNSTEELSKMDVLLLELIKFIRNYSILLYSVIAIILVSKTYYRNRLQKPIEIMTEAAKHIAQNDMSYSCRYESADEMGKLCGCLDDMRNQLIREQEAVWLQMENQKTLNAAFAHDLRTPLTVLSGYVDMLVKYYPQGNISESKMTEILETMQGQLSRMVQFTDTMKTVNSLEEWRVNKKETALEDIREKIDKTARGLVEKHNTEKKSVIDVSVYSKEKEQTILAADEYLILEVAENLLTNALRYARKNIKIVLDYRENQRLLELYVHDDGKGFRECEVEKLTEPYKRGEGEEPGEHFGLGLSICRLLCQKHGGDLELTNSITGGAIVCAAFSCGKNNSEK